MVFCDSARQARERERESTLPLQETILSTTGNTGSTGKNNSIRKYLSRRCTQIDADEKNGNAKRRVESVTLAADGARRVAGDGVGRRKEEFDPLITLIHTDKKTGTRMSRM